MQTEASISRPETSPVASQTKQDLKSHNLALWSPDHQVREFCGGGCGSYCSVHMICAACILAPS